MSKSRLATADRQSVLWEMSDALDQYLADVNDDEAYDNLRAAYRNLESLPEALTDMNIRDAIDAYSTDSFRRMKDAIGRALDN